MAMSAIRAGLRPWCADLFADADLRAVAPAVQLPMEEYPDGFRRLLEAAPKVPVLYTGGLENAPRLLDAIRRERPLWGTGPEVLRQVRSPFAVAGWLRDAKLPSLDVYRSPNEIPRGMKCLRKSFRSAGGLGVGFHDGEHRRGCYYQRFVEGECFSALYIDGRFVAATEQLTDGFRYAGTIAPREAPELLRTIGEVIAERGGVRGLWGLDGIIAGGVPWLVEVNPRYPASAEVVELATGTALLGWHENGYSRGRLPPTDGTPSRRCAAALPRKGGGDKSDPSRFFGPLPPCGGGLGWGVASAATVVGKRVVYAVRPFTYAGSSPLPFDPWTVPAFADIPAPGTAFEAGQPILTVFAEGGTRDEVRARLDAASGAFGR